MERLIYETPSLTHYSKTTLVIYIVKINQIIYLDIGIKST